MTKQIRSLIILVGVLISLIAVWLGSSIWSDRKSASETTPIESTVAASLFDLDHTQIDQLIIRNTQGELVFQPQPSTDDQTEQRWTLVSPIDLPISESAVNALANAAVTATSSQVIQDDATDLTPFGLQDSPVSLTIVLTNGQTAKLAIGDDLSSGSGAYARKDQDNRIVAVSLALKTQLQKTIADLIDTSMLSGGIEFNQITGLTFERKADSLLLESTGQANNPDDASAGFSFDLTSPVKRPGNADTLSTLVNNALSLSVVQVVDLEPADLSVYGLDQPNYRLVLDTADGAVLDLRIGDRAPDNQYYVTSNALPAVLTFYASDLPAIDLPVEDYVDRFVALQSIWTVERAEIDLGDVSFTLEIEMDKNQKATDEGVVFKVNGQDATGLSASGTSLFSTFYQRLISIQLAGFDLQAQPDGPIDYRLVYHLKSDPATGKAARDQMIEFSRRDAYTDYVLIDGDYTGYYVNHEDTLDRETIGSEGLRVAYRQLIRALDPTTETSES